jgi:hypothetical protein
MVWPGTRLTHSIFLDLKSLRILLVGKAIQFLNDLLSRKIHEFSLQSLRLQFI